MPDKKRFHEELRAAINRTSMESASDTPDFILADYLLKCLDNYSEAVSARDKWFGVDMWSENKLRKEVQS